MIVGITDLLEGTSQAGVLELRATLEDLLGGAGSDGRLLYQERVDRSVYRLHFEVDGKLRAIVVKRTKWARAQRNMLVIRRWLPIIGLERAAPELHATAAERGGRNVWHIYEDLGTRTLESERDCESVRSAVSLLGELHTRAAGHPLLPECRELGGDLGIRFYETSVRGAIECLEAIPPPEHRGSLERAALLDRLLERMEVLLAEQRERATAMEELGGPDTLLHGDLWLGNVILTPEGVRLIDWDHVAVGPIAYDLSTFLNRFPVAERDHVLDLYRDAVGHAGWELPAAGELNPLFATCELARCANCVVWPALAAAEGRDVGWAFEDLALVEGWLEALDPVLSEVA